MIKGRCYALLPLLNLTINIYFRISILTMNAIFVSRFFGGKMITMASSPARIIGKHKYQFVRDGILHARAKEKSVHRAFMLE